jgi:hypothetical protein
MKTKEELPSSVPFIDKVPTIITQLTDNPVVVIALAFLGNKFWRWANDKTERIKAALFFSQRKDQHIALILQTLRESVRCDRVVLGLLVNGETSITAQYHIKSLIITHESLGAGIKSLNAEKRGKIPISAMSKENDLYEKQDYAFAQITAELDPNCRRYLDSIDCLQILTFRLNTTYKKEIVALGYLSFQWTKKTTSCKTEQDISDLLGADNKRDFLYFKNNLTDIILSSKDNQKMLLKIEKL